MAGTRVKHWRALLQQGADARIGRTAPLNQVQQPAIGKHWPDKVAKVHGKTGQLAQRQAALLYQPGPHANGKQK